MNKVAGKMSREQEDAFIAKANFISSGKETVKIFLREHAKLKQGQTVKMLMEKYYSLCFWCFSAKKERKKLQYLFKEIGTAGGAGVTTSLSVK